jgi:hypothetical protein
MTRKVRPGDIAGDIQSGTLTAVALTGVTADKLMANVNGAVRQLIAARGLVTGSGDVILVHRYGQLWIASTRVYSSAVTELPPVLIELDPNPTVINGTLTVTPVFAGTWYPVAGWTDIHIYQGKRNATAENGTGAAFYGDKPSSLAGAVVTGLRLEQLRGGSHTVGVPATMRLITEKTRPAGAPTLGASTSGPPTPTADNDFPISFTLPTSWGQALVDGTAGGIGMFSATGVPWVSYWSKLYLPAAWTIVIDWTRTV